MSNPNVEQHFARNCGKARQKLNALSCICSFMNMDQERHILAISHHNQSKLIRLHRYIIQKKSRPTILKCLPKKIEKELLNPESIITVCHNLSKDKEIAPKEIKNSYKNVVRVQGKVLSAIRALPAVLKKKLIVA